MKTTTKVQHLVVVPYRFKDEALEFLVCIEDHPVCEVEPLCAILKELEPSDSCTREVALSTFDTMGYDFPIEAMIPLGKCWLSKTETTICHLYTVNLTDKTPVSKGDCKWISEKSVVASPDPLVHITINKLRNLPPGVKGDDSLVEEDGQEPII